MLRHISPVLLAAALLIPLAAAMATDRASATENQGRVAANDAAVPGDATAPRPIKKKLHHGTARKHRAAAKKTVKKVLPAAAGGSTKAN